MAEHLIPFKGKKHSGSVNQNLLWRDGNVYLMDNHRAALWCWQQEIDLYATKHSILHIDRHTDCLGANIGKHLEAAPDLRGLSIEDYLAANVELECLNPPLFRWDNYLSIHLATFGQNVATLRSIDHGDGDDPDYALTMRPRPDELPENMLYWLRHGCPPWIVNIDLDYFFSPAASDDDSETIWLPLFSDAFIATVFGQIKTALDEGLIAVVTVCLMPTDYTPGWDECLNLSHKVLHILGARHPDL